MSLIRDISPVSRIEESQKLDAHMSLHAVANISCGPLSCLTQSDSITHLLICRATVAQADKNQAERRLGPATTRKSTALYRSKR